MAEKSSERKAVLERRRTNPPEKAVGLRGGREDNSPRIKRT